MTPDQTPQREAAEPERRPAIAGNAWAWPSMWAVGVLIIVAGIVYVFRSCRDLPGETLDKTSRLVDKIGREAQLVASAFKQGSISTTFTSYATSISGSHFLQFASLNQNEVFTRTDESSLLWGYLPLPDVIVEARAPVTYTYYLDLNAPWDFALQDGVIYVTAPDIKFNKPAVDASRIAYEVKKDSHFRNTTEAMENLKASITWLSYKKAETNIGLVRETGRRQTETFVQNWVARSFSDGKRYPIKVRFHDETANRDAGLVPTPKDPAAR